MEYKNIRFVIVAVIGFTILTTAYSMSVTRNYYSVKSQTPIKADGITYVVKLGAQLHKSNNEQR